MWSMAQGRHLGVAVTAAALLALAACSSSGAQSGGSGSSAAGTAPATTSAGGAGAYGDESTPATAAAGAVTSLTTADTSLGTIVVDGNGMTVYQFDKDTQGGGTSSCSGQCATQWPEVHGDAQSVQADGVTGMLGTITGTDGQPQLTLNGWPLYYYQGDAAAGDTKGQGVGGIWWVLTPAGERVAG